MYNDTQSIKQFEHMHARERLAEEARHIGDIDEASFLGAHLSGEREAQRLMIVASLAALAVVAGLAWFCF